MTKNSFNGLASFLSFVTTGIGIISLFCGCASMTQKDQPHPQSVALMAYNVENLFDTQQDANRDDYTFLPLSLKGTQEHRRNCARVASGSRLTECLEMDWNEAVLGRKLSRIANVILSANDGRGPDILILEEVENIRVLRQLNEGFLKKAHYQTVVLIEGPDKRGIDVGMLSRFPLQGEPRLHQIEFQGKSAEDSEWMARSRGILEATFQLPSGEPITAFGVHLPSQANPTYWREQAISSINKLQRQLPPGRMAFVGGDFNISREEDSSKGLFRDMLGRNWLITHYLGCGNCQGTHNYRGSWSFLDALLFVPEMAAEGQAPWRVDVKSIEVVNTGRYQTSNRGQPAGFDINRAVGTSDHYPIFARIFPRANAQASAAN